MRFGGAVIGVILPVPGFLPWLLLVPQRIRTIIMGFGARRQLLNKSIATFPIKPVRASKGGVLPSNG